MTDKGKLVCWECDDFATWIDEPPVKSATSCDYWCEKHCPKDLVLDWNRYKIKQELVSFPDDSKIWYPYFLVDGKWMGWPLIWPDELKKSWWQFWK